MTDRRLLTMTLIARDEAHNIDRCFTSWWNDVDEVILCDTGSKDDTILAAQRFAKERGEPGKLVVTHFDWCNDFAAARNHADSLATGEWLAWCDLDDTIQGLDTIRPVITDADPGLHACFCVYDYAQDQDGNCISQLWRERVVRNNGTPWHDRLHEHKTLTGAVYRVAPEQARWIHHRDHATRTGDRNLAILEQWQQDEPDSPRVLASLGLEYMAAERHAEASDVFAKVLATPGEPPDRRIQACRHMCVQLVLQGRLGEAKQAAHQMLAENALYADTHLTLAEIAQSEGQPQLGVMHAQNALSLGQPDTVLIINPLMYTAHPRALIAVCLAMLGKWEQAIGVAEEVLAIAPHNAIINDQLPAWRGQLQRDRTLAAFLACEEVLRAAGELYKARDLLATVPFYLTDHPAVTQRRAIVRRLIVERLNAPATIDDPQADRLLAELVELAA